MSNLCSLCSLPADLRCSGCQSVFYCSRECQKKHWKAHKTHCKPFKVLETKEMGRVLVATRDLKPGELVLSEGPVLTAPMPCPNTICVACCAIKNKLKRCARCGWPVCSEECSRLPSHLPECTLTQEQLLSRLDSVPELNSGHTMVLVLELLAVLRFLYLKRFDDVYVRMKELEDHQEERRRVGKLQKDMALLQIARHSLNLDPSTFSDNEFLHACGALFVNGHELPPVSPHLAACMALYVDASVLEHSCVNNASKHFRETQLQIRAAQSVKRNERLAINYSDPMWGTRMRQTQLRETKFFECQCPRCRDPTELGTHFSSIRCFRCPVNKKKVDENNKKINNDDDEIINEAYLVPPIDCRSRKWRCLSCGCTEDASVVDRVLAVIGAEQSRLQPENVEGQLAFLAKHEQVLHANHYILTETRLVLCQIVDKFENCRDFLQLKQRLCQEVLAVVNVISPGISRLRALVLYELQCARMEMLKTDCLPVKKNKRNKKSDKNGNEKGPNQNFAPKSQVNREHLRAEFKDVSSKMAECGSIFAFESSGVAEGRLAGEAKRRAKECSEMADSV